MVMSECHLKLHLGHLPDLGSHPQALTPVVSGSLGLLLMGLNFTKLMSSSLGQVTPHPIPACPNQ